MSRTPVQIKGKYLITVEVDGRRITEYFHIMENMPQDCIIGTDLMPSNLEGGMLDLNTFQVSNKITGEIFKEFKVMGWEK